MGHPQPWSDRCDGGAQRTRARRRARTRPRARDCGLGVNGADGETTAGTSVGIDLAGSNTRATFQAGIGWVSFDAFGGVTSLRLPLGLAIRGRTTSQGITLSPWIMPRAEIVSVRNRSRSAWTTDFGASTGVWLSGSGGVGMHVLLDAVHRDGERLWHLGLGFQWDQNALREVFRAP